MAFLNLLVRPVLNVISFPLFLFSGIIAIILVNVLFLWLTLQIVEGWDPARIGLAVTGGAWGWILSSLALGLGNWVMKKVD